MFQALGIQQLKEKFSTFKEFMLKQWDVNNKEPLDEGKRGE